MKFEIIKVYEKNNNSILQSDFTNGICKIEIGAKEGIIIHNALNMTDFKKGFYLSIKGYKSSISFIPNIEIVSLYVFVFGELYNNLKIMNYGRSAKFLVFSLKPIEGQESFDIMPNVSLYYKQI